MMKKNQSSTRRKQTKETSSRGRLGVGRVAFLARKDAIKEKLDAGYTMVLVYEEYQSRLGIGYAQFVNYVNKFIRGKPAVSKTKEIPNEDRAPEEKPKEDGGSSERLYLRAWRDSSSLSDAELF